MFICLFCKISQVVFDIHIVYTETSCIRLQVRHRGMPQRWWSEMRHEMAFLDKLGQVHDTTVTIHSHTNLEDLKPHTCVSPLTISPHIHPLGLLWHISLLFPLRHPACTSVFMPECTYMHSFRLSFIFSITHSFLFLPFLFSLRQGKAKKDMLIRIMAVNTVGSYPVSLQEVVRVP